MTRHSTVLSLHRDQPDIEGIAVHLLSAIRETKAEGKDPSADPAVMLLGARLSFLTHADVATEIMYRKLIDACEQREAAVIIKPESVQ